MRYKRVVRETRSGVKVYEYPIDEESKREYNKKYYGRTSHYDRRPWNRYEEELIITSKLSDRELSDELSRSVKSIQAKRRRIIVEGREWLNPGTIQRKASKRKTIVVT